MFDKLEQLIHSELERSGVPGLAIALVKDEDVVWSHGFGYADLQKKRPVTPSVPFSIQSVTKPVVTTAFMQWHERGRFLLDDPVNNHLIDVQVENEWEASNPVTIRRLLTHTSGLPVDVEAAPPTSETAVPLSAYLADVAKTVRPPGADMVYANWGYDLIGLLVGQFADQSYEEYLRQHVLEPLDMTSTGIEEPPDVAKGYFLSALDGRHYAPEPMTWPTQPPRPCGSLYSTVEDLARFLIAHLNGGLYKERQILSAQTVDQMHSLQARCGPLDSGMGLGFRVDNASGRRLICHGGDGTTFTAFIGAYPEEKVGAVVLINMGRAQTTRSVVANAALRTLLGDYHALDLADLRRQADADWSGIAGRYVSNYWSIDATISAADGLAVANVEGAIVATEGGERSYLEFQEPNVARAHGGPFDGFDLGFEPGDGNTAPRFYGGLYATRYDWQGEAPSASELSVDVTADVVGEWSGSVASPLGPLPMTLGISDAQSAIVTTLSVAKEPVAEFSAKKGHVHGSAQVSLPGFGEFDIFLRLRASQGKLVGRVYARGAFGEVPMRAELIRM